LGDGKGGRSGEERKRKRKVSEVGYLYEIYIRSYFIVWNFFVRNFFLCHSAKRISFSGRGKVIKHRSSGGWHQSKYILSR